MRTSTRHRQLTKKGPNIVMISLSHRRMVYIYYKNRPETALSRNRIKEPSRPAQNSRYYRGRPFSAKARVQSERSVGQSPGHINGKDLAQRIGILRKWFAHDDEITSITYCAEEKQLITGSSDTSVSVWTLKRRPRRNIWTTAWLL